MNEIRLINTAATVSGVVATGAIALGFRVGHESSAVINGIPLNNQEGREYNLPVLPRGVFYPAVPYTLSSGTLYITEVRE